MIQYPYIQQCHGLFQTGSDGMIRCARFRMAAWVVVNQQDCRCLMAQTVLNDHSGVNFCAIDAAVEQFLESDKPMSGIQEGTREYFTTPVTKLAS